MFRYRCPHCSQILQSVEIRAGKLTVCSRCSQPLTIPSDQAHWLNERGEPLLGSPTVLIPGVPPEVVAAARGSAGGDAETDVLGAIFVGAKNAREMPTQKELEREFLTPPPQPSPSVAAEGLAPESPLPTPTLPSSDSPNPPLVETPAAVHRSQPTPPPRRSPLRPITPAPRSAALVPVAPLPNPPVATGRHESEPLRLRSQMDVAAELTNVLTTRMKPPPEPPRDIKPSTAAWMVTTGIAVALLVLALVSSNDFLQWLVVIGVGQVLAGYFWVVYIASRRDWRRGLLAAFPLATPWFLGQWKYAKYRPARFVLTGAVLLTAAGLSGYAVPVTRGWGFTSTRTPTAAPIDEIDTQPKHLRLQAYKKDARLPALLELLEELAKTDQLLSDDAKYRVELANELRQLCKHDDSGVRVRAIEAYSRWGGEDARDLALKFLNSPIQDEREVALRLLPRWKDPEVARAVAGHIGRAGGNETALAIKGLTEIGGPLAEDALIARLEADDQGTRLQVIKLLTQPGIGGPTALAKLRQLAENPPPTSKAFADKTTREEAGKAAASLAAQLQKK